MTAWIVKLVSKTHLLPELSMNSAMAVIGIGDVGSEGVPTNRVPSSHVNHEGRDGDRHWGLIVSDAACGSHIRGSHS